MSSLKIKKGDQVVVISGKEKGKKGKIQTVEPEKNKVIVQGVNFVSKHKKPRGPGKMGGIIKQENTINASNVMLLCSKCNKGTRVGYTINDGKKVRICKKCGATL
ncbi:MAG: 50S ribosomal protein L24 [Eubacteriales bacterium]